MSVFQCLCYFTMIDSWRQLPSNVLTWVKLGGTIKQTRNKMAMWRIPLCRNVLNCCYKLHSFILQTPHFILYHIVNAIMWNLCDFLCISTSGQWNITGFLYINKDEECALSITQNAHLSAITISTSIIAHCYYTTLLYHILELLSIARYAGIYRHAADPCAITADKVW